MEPIPIRPSLLSRQDDQRLCRTKTAPGRLVVVSNRVADLAAAHQSGGLAVAVGEALNASGGIWFGWSGELAEDALERPPQIKTSGRTSAVTVGLTPDEHEHYYLGHANRCLWPLFHYRLDLAEFSSEAEAVYFAVNKRFAAHVAPLLGADDTVWVHDYQLVPFASFLRQRQVTNPIGFFLHIPFPSPEVFAGLPNHKQFARTFFAYDLVGFQTVRDRENFARYAETHLGCRRLNDGRLQGFGRNLRIEAVPIGIDVGSFAQEAEANVRAPELRHLARFCDMQHLIVGVDRLDYSKGLPERVRAVDALLNSHPGYRGRLKYLQIAPPTREGLHAYDAIREEFERLAGNVNGRHGDFAWSPVHYVHRPVARPLLAGLFRRSRVGLVTPLRDGMNLVAKEYVAAQDPENPGVLVLSEFAGAAEQLEEALLVNPHDSGSMAETIHRALEMPLGERRARHISLLSRIADEDIDWWRERFLSLLARTRDAGRQPHLDRPRTPFGKLRHEAEPDIDAA
jgi:trehalose 6-phosphate synthase